MSTNKFNLKKTVSVAVLAALTAVVAFIPLRTFGLEITFSMVPVAVGAIAFGPTAGAILGGTFGIVSLLQCLGYSPFGAALFSISPLYAVIVCIPTRILAGYLAGLICMIINKHVKNRNISYCISSLASAVLNTALFMTAFVLCYYNTDLVQGLVTSLNATNVFMFVILFVGINGLVEILLGFLIAFPCAKAAVKYIN